MAEKSNNRGLGCWGMGVGITDVVGAYLTTCLAPGQFNPLSEGSLDIVVDCGNSILYILSSPILYFQKICKQYSFSSLFLHSHDLFCCVVRQWSITEQLVTILREDVFRKQSSNHASFILLFY